MSTDRFPYRYAYERLDSTSATARSFTVTRNVPAELVEATAPLYLFLNYNSAPSELPYIEGYKFNGRMNLKAGDEPIPTVANLTGINNLTPVGEIKPVPIHQMNSCIESNCLIHCDDPNWMWDATRRLWFLGRN